MKARIAAAMRESIGVKQALLADDDLLGQMEQLAQDCLRALRAGGKIIFAGNGGSFADSQHLAAEFVSRLQFDRAPLPSVALGTNSSSMSAVGNDYGYDQVFARELRALAGPHDVFVPISTSGNSPNILAAVAVALELPIRSVGLTGETGGKLAEVCSCLRVPSSITERIQESHILLGHILCAQVESAYFNRVIA